MRAVAQEPQTVNVRQVWRPVFLWAAAAGFLLAVLAVVVAMTDLRSPPPRTPAVQPETLPQQALNAPAEPSNPQKNPGPSGLMYPPLHPRQKLHLRPSPW